MATDGLGRVRACFQPGVPGPVLRDWDMRGMLAMRNPIFNPEHKPTGDTSLSVATTAAEEAALEKFGTWLDGELDVLVARWGHLAAPNAAHRARSTRSMF